MIRLLLVLGCVFGVNVFASPFDPPADASADEKASWAKARCKWRMVEEPQLIGYEMDVHVPSAEQCWLEARIAMILSAQDPESSPADRVLARRPWDVIWDDPAGERKICRMRALKEQFDPAREGEMKAAFIDHDPVALTKAKRLADENLAIECP